jgi:FAD/FMN-containing dehydrogenase
MVRTRRRSTGRGIASNATVLRALREALGDQGVLASPDDLERYAEDALGGSRAAGAPLVTPLAVALPASTADVVALVRVAAEHRVPVVPYGGGSGLMGGARSIEPAVVVSMERMRRVRELDAMSGVAWVEAGCVLRELDEAVRPHGLRVGHDPWTFGIATVGGAFSTNGLGFLGGAYGSMAEQVLGVEAVLSDGSVARTPAVRPRSTGLMLDRLFAGTEGAFGVVTAVALRLFPLPEAETLVGYRFRAFADGFDALLEMRRAEVSPAILDFGDERPRAGVRSPATLYVGFLGARQVVAAQLGRARAACEAHGGRPVGAREVRSFWDSRHEVAERFARARARGQRLRPVGEGRASDYVHVSLPLSQVLAYRERALATVAERNVQALETGLWVTPGLFSLTMMAEGPDAASRMSQAVDACLRLAHERGGSIEYCHGVGVRLAHLMAHEHGDALTLVQRLKRAADPDGILNPGKAGIG